MNFGKAGGRNPRNRNATRLPRYTAYRVAVVAIVVVLGVQIAIPIEVQLKRVVVIVDHRRPVVAVAANFIRVTVPVPGVRPK